MRLRARRGFDDGQVNAALEKQEGRCPCCRRSIAHVKCGWDAHHRDGDRGNNKGSNLLVVCVDCHHNCYHDEHGVSRQPTNCRVVRAPVFKRTGRLCGCGGCGQCTSPYKACTTEIRTQYARTCSYCAA